MGMHVCSHCLASLLIFPLMLTFFSFDIFPVFGQYLSKKKAWRILSVITNEGFVCKVSFCSKLWCFSFSILEELRFIPFVLKNKNSNNINEINFTIKDNYQYGIIITMWKSKLVLMWPTLGTVTFGIIGFIRPLWSTSMHFPQITKLTFKIRQKLFIYSVNCIPIKCFVRASHNHHINMSSTS